MASITPCLESGSDECDRGACVGFPGGGVERSGFVDGVAGFGDRERDDARGGRRDLHCRARWVDAEMGEQAADDAHVGRVDPTLHERVQVVLHGEARGDGPVVLAHAGADDPPGRRAALRKLVDIGGEVGAYEVPHPQVHHAARETLPVVGGHGHPWIQHGQVCTGHGRHVGSTTGSRSSICRSLVAARDVLREPVDNPDMGVEPARPAVRVE